MSIKQHIAASRERGTKPAAARAKAKKAEGKDEDEGMEGEDEDDAEAEGEDEPEPNGRKAAKAKKARGKKAEGEEDDAEAEGEEDDATAEGDDDEEEGGAVAADPGTVAQLCADAGVPHMAKPLIDRGLSLGKVKARIASAGNVRGLVAAAGRISRAVDPKIAEGFIKNGASVQHVKAELFDMIVSAQGPEIRNSHGAAADGSPGPSGNYGWDKVTDKINAQSGS